MAVAIKTILTARLVLEYGGQTLFLLQTPKNGGGYTLPGGKVEEEEFIKEALIRECFEEVGIRLKSKNLQLVHLIHKRLKNSTEIIFFFHANHWDGELRVRELNKFKEAIWYTNEAIPKGLPRILEYALKRIRKGDMYSDYPKIKKPKSKKKDKIDKPDKGKVITLKEFSTP